MSASPQSANVHRITPARELVRALEQENEQLRNALESRVVIEQAKGALSARLGILPEEAFELLRGLARSQRRKLQEFAAEVVQNRGRLDGDVVGVSGQSLGRRP
jgi:AmiR/NasT family two-component response regulator